MLVLSRQRDESIMIGDDVEITVTDVRGDKVKLGITAPRHIPVHRREVYDEIQREKAQKGQLGTATPSLAENEAVDDGRSKKAQAPEPVGA